MEFQLMMAPPLEQMEQQDHDILSIQQSLELVKIFLNSSIACICHTRELLPWTSDCLLTRYIEQTSVICDEHDQIYHNFLNVKALSPSSSQQVRVLVRSRNERANCILDMLEHGVFDAIEAAYLDTLIVFVATDSCDDKNVLETYTYQFEYDRDRVASINVEEIKQPFTLLQSQKSFKAAIRGLLRAMQGMPRLPKKCVLGMSMSYKGSCPKGYEPEGFADASSHSIERRDWDALWRPPRELAACFDTAHHIVQIATKGPDAFGPTTSQLQDTAMCKELQNMQKTSSSRNHGLQSTVDAVRSPPRKRKQAEEVDGMQPEVRCSKRRCNEMVAVMQEEIDKPEQLGDLTEVTEMDDDSRIYDQERHPTTKPSRTPRGRKKSISKVFVAICDSTPVSQRYCDDAASEADATGITRSSRVSSAATEV